VASSLGSSTPKTYLLLSIVEGLWDNPGRL
jgi:hypothetical protein